MNASRGYAGAACELMRGLGVITVQESDKDKVKKTGIKICGMRRAQDIEAAAKYRPDYIGFILSQGFRRTVSFDAAREMTGLLHSLEGPGEQGADQKARPDNSCDGADGIAAVGVFVNEPMENVILAAEGTEKLSPFIDMIQLHGQEDENYICELRNYTGKPVIKAFRIRGAEDLEAAQKCTADLVLLDNGTGTGSTFDWTLLRDLGRPWIMAGGLGPDNLEEAIERFHPYAVDLSSGTETDGWKDPEKIRTCVEIVRRLNL